MNVTCPNCATVYRVDPAKVPEGGIRARCAVCSAVFPVAREGERAAAPPAPEPPSSSPRPEPTAPAPATPVTPPTPGAPPARPVGQPRPAAPPAFAGDAARPTPAPTPAHEPARPAPPATPRPVNPFLSQDPALKARRLARALISDMVVYHPAKRQEGLRNDTLKELFHEEIKKSWEEYTEQVGREVAESSPYFREALNEILAGGKQIF